MKIKEFESLTLKDCLQQVRQEMGPEAVILETKKTRVGGVMGFGQREAVRIVAATGISVDEPRARRRNASATASVSVERDPESRTGEKRREPENAAQFLARQAESNEPASSDSATAQHLARLEEEIGELKRGILDMKQAAVVTPRSPAAPPAPLTDIYVRLRDNDVPEVLAGDLIAYLREASELPSAMASRVGIGGPIALTEGETKVVAFVGPTGVGKTTTIAKLAAQFALVEKRRVGLVTMDTYRIAAVEQLKTYSQIMDVPVEVVHGRAGIGPALEQFRGFDLVLIDTAGRSQRNALQIGELKAMVEGAGCETHLVLAASTRERDLRDQIERFGPVGIDRLLFTKLDETTTYGTLYSAAVTAGIPLSYLTAGQKVPEDIEIASAAGLVERVLA